jgi:hypothetical protein
MAIVTLETVKRAMSDFDEQYHATTWTSSAVSIRSTVTGKILRVDELCSLYELGKVNTESTGFQLDAKTLVNRLNSHSATRKALNGKVASNKGYELRK